jgi:hypothetical protein
VKGLDLSESYYRRYGAVMIEEKFPRYKERIAAGLVGEGSECYGFDDEISRDHDWGPGFCLWLNKEDYEAVGSSLQAEYERLPGSFRGFERENSRWGAGRVGVFEIGAFYRKFTGLSHAPHTPLRWLQLSDERVAACTNGKVFVDPLGRFSEIREAFLAFYPEDVRLLRLAAACLSAGQAGQYNYMRSIRRGEYYTAQYAETKFSADVLSLVFLLNRRYAPFYKWRHRAVHQLPILGAFMHQKVSHIAAAHDHKEKLRLIEEMSAAVIEELQRQELSHSRSDFLVDHAFVIREKIKDPELRKVLVIG